MGWLVDVASLCLFVAWIFWKFLLLDVGMVTGFPQHFATALAVYFGEIRFTL